MHQSWVIDRRSVEAYVAPKEFPHGCKSPEETASDRDKRTARGRSRTPDPPPRARTLRGPRPRGRSRTRRLAPRRRRSHEEERPPHRRLMIRARKAIMAPALRSLFMRAKRRNLRREERAPTCQVILNHLRPILDNSP